ncbi:MaoC family dehydratase [uncultured Sphingomonas sp.]|uniref:MaoC family dehydratase n=1 Tax=uncultured Sphingomonas sp. TaxID=158754 RepID=UPI0035C9F4E6
MPRTLHLDELPDLVGKEIGASGWVRIDQAMVDDFARLTRDHQWIHVDVARAQREAGGTIAHGFLILSMIGGLTGEIALYPDVARGLNYGFDKVRFTAPVPVGAEIRLRETVVSVEPKGEGISYRRMCRIDLNNGGGPALVAEWLTLLFKTGPAPRK